MVVLEGLVLLSVGLLFGMASTVFDVLFVGSASFLTHFGLWVFVNALLAVHVDSRTKAIWWSVPFNLGFVESYFITTAASYEGFAKSLVVPLAALAFASPLLVYALWTARSHNQNAYGKSLTAFTVVGAIVASYFINGKLSIYDFVIGALTAAVILVMPAKRIKISRSKLAASEQPEVAPVEGLEYDTPSGELAAATGLRKARASRVASTRDKSEKTAKPTKLKRKRFTLWRGKDDAAEAGRENTPDSSKRRSRLAARREKRVSENRSREERSREERSREERREDRRAPRPQRRTRRENERREQPANEVPMSNIAFLGTARTPRRSTRGRRSDSQ